MNDILNKLTTLTIGNRAEKQALAFLKSKGLKKITQNFKSKYGEIDLIMLDGDVLVFIEVRFRKDSKMGMAFETVDRKKQKKIIATSEFFLQSNPEYQNHYVRFDVVGFVQQLNNIHWIKSAYET